MSPDQLRLLLGGLAVIQAAVTVHLAGAVYSGNLIWYEGGFAVAGPHPLGPVWFDPEELIDLTIHLKVD